MCLQFLTDGTLTSLRACTCCFYCVFVLTMRANLIVILLTSIIIDLRSITTTWNEITYSFKYAVEAGNVVTHHWEERRGDLVRGAYSLLEPNGKVRIVQYQADDRKGFRAVVKHRNPPGRPLLGHLQHPRLGRKPIRFAKPVGLIGKDLLNAPKSYPNLPLW